MNELRLPMELRPEMVTAIIDTREQLPLALSPLKTEAGTLATGDYSIKGLERRVAIERKSLSDFVSCCGCERERFEREIQRLLAYEVRAIVVESSWAALELGGWRAKVSPRSVVGSTLGWIARGVPILLPGDRMAADQLTARLLFITARRHWRELRTLAGGILQFTPAQEVDSPQ